jgi:hypothetical protein
VLRSTFAIKQSESHSSQRTRDSSDDEPLFGRVAPGPERVNTSRPNPERFVLARDDQLSIFTGESYPREK